MQSLSDITIIDLSQNLAGPYCTQILGDLGADVIKVERPGTGDSARAWGPPFWGGEATIFLAGNRNKRSVAVDLQAPGGPDVVRRLAASADVFLHSLRAGTAVKYGLDAERLRARDPRLIYCSVSAFGEDGPLSDRPGYDPLAQAYGGLMSVTGHPDGPPARVGTSIVDMGTGMWAALGVLAALRDRSRTGAGAHVTTSLFDTALQWMSYHAVGYLGTGRVPGPLGTGLGMIAPYEAFPTADGHLMIAAGNDGLFRRLCQALELPGLADDPRFGTNPDRVDHRDELFDALAGATRREPREAVRERLESAGVPCAPIRSVDEVVAEPQVESNRMLPEAEHPRLDGFRSVALPVEWDGDRAPVRRAPPSVGQHTEEVLRAFGFDADEVERLEADGAVARGGGD